MKSHPKKPIYTLPHGIEVIGEYRPNKQCKYWRVRLRVHPLFPDTKVVCGGICVRRNRVVMTSVLGRPLKPCEHVHHKDENCENDSPDNLEVLTAAEHNAEHKCGFKHNEDTKQRIRASLENAYREGRKTASVRI